MVVMTIFCYNKTMKQGKIYIVEDDETIVKLLKQHLSQTYDVFSVTNFRAITGSRRNQT